MCPISISKISKLVPFTQRWIPSLCSWIKTRDELIYWSGNTFLGKKFGPETFRSHLKTSGIFPFASLDENGELLAYGEIVRKIKEVRVTLCRIIVHPDKRAQGMGKKFSQSLIEKSAIFKPCECIRLNVLSDNKPAISCYFALGFKTIGLVPKARRIGPKQLDLLIMSKTVGRA